MQFLKGEVNMDNTNTICPLCNKDFSDSTNDNIIKCPDCGINYHKNCWELNGGCSTADCTQKPIKYATT